MGAIRSYYEGRKLRRALRKMRADEQQRRQLAELMNQAMGVGFEDPRQLNEIGRALFEKGIGRDVDWPKGPGKGAVLAQAQRAGPEETRRLVETGEASPDLLDLLGADKQFAKQVFGEEKEYPSGQLGEYYRIGDKMKKGESLTAQEKKFFRGYERGLASKGREGKEGPGALTVAATKELLITDPKLERKEVRRWVSKFNEVWADDAEGEPWNKPPFANETTLKSQNEATRKKIYKRQSWLSFRREIPGDLRWDVGEKIGVHGEIRPPEAPQKPRADRTATKAMKAMIDQGIEQGSSREEIMEAISADEERLRRDGVDIEALLKYLESKGGGEGDVAEEVIGALLGGGA